MDPRAVGRSPRPEPDRRLSARPRDLARQRAREVEGARRVPAARLDGAGPDLAPGARTFWLVRARAEAHSAHVDPRLSARAAGAGPDDAELAAGGELTGVRSLGRLPARDRRCARLHHRRQLWSHSLGPVRPAPTGDC